MNVIARRRLIGCSQPSSARHGPAETPDAVVSADPAGFYNLFVYGDLDAVHIGGDPDAVRKVVEAAALHDVVPAAVAAV